MDWGGRRLGVRRRFHLEAAAANVDFGGAGAEADDGGISMSWGEAFSGLEAPATRTWVPGSGCWETMRPAE